MRRRRLTGALTLGTLVLTGACAHRGPVTTWPALLARVRPGVPVAVIDRNGVEQRGRVTGTAGGVLTMRARDGQLRTFGEPGVRLVRRDGDPTWNGWLIGGAIGGLGAIMSDPRCTGQPPVCGDAEVPSRVAFAGALAAAGWMVDRLYADRRPLYVAPGAADVGRGGSPAPAP